MAKKSEIRKTKNTENKSAQTLRAEELLACFESLGETQQTIIAPLVDQAAYLEGELDKLRALPLLLVDKNTPIRQQQTPAAALYSRLVSRYADIIAKLTRIQQGSEAVEDSPLRAYLKGLDRD